MDAFKTRRSTRHSGRKANEGSKIDNASVKTHAVQPFDPLKVKDLDARKKVIKPRRKKTLKQSRLNLTATKADANAEPTEPTKSKRATDSTQDKAKKKQKLSNKADEETVRVLEESAEDNGEDKAIEAQSANGEPYNNDVHHDVSVDLNNTPSGDAASMHADKVQQTINKEAVVEHQSKQVRSEITTDDVESWETSAEASSNFTYERSLSPPSFASYHDEPETPLNHAAVEVPHRSEFSLLGKSMPSSLPTVLSSAPSETEDTSFTNLHRPLHYRTAADKQRIEYEKTTLIKLRRALDIVITERMAHSRPVLFHEVQHSLRNSTGRSVTLTHVSQIMYVAPNLYLVQAKEIRDYMGRAKEAHVIECGVDWVVPLSAKDFVKRADILEEAIDKYFRDHPESDAVIPQAKLPCIKILTDKDEWKKSDNLPPGVKAILAAQEKARQAEEEAKKPKPKRTGTVAERMAALKARIAARSEPSSSSSSNQRTQIQ